MANVNDTLVERGGRYGKFRDNAKIAQDLKKYVRTCGSWSELEDDQREAIDNILIKMSRILSPGTDKTYTDNWIDMAGYATLVVERIEGNER